VRIVAWNCCRGPLDKKLAALAQLAPEATAPCRSTQATAPEFTGPEGREPWALSAPLQ